MSDTTTRVPLREQTAEEIRALLARRKMSATELARRLDVSQAYVWRRLSGETAFDLDDLERIADVLDVKVVDLLPGSANGRSPMPPLRPVSNLAARPTTRRPHNPGPNPSRARPNTPAPEHGPHERTRRPARISTRVAA